MIWVTKPSFNLWTLCLKWKTHRFISSAASQVVINYPEWEVIWVIVSHLNMKTRHSVSKTANIVQKNARSPCRRKLHVSMAVAVANGTTISLTTVIICQIVTKLTQQGSRMARSAQRSLCDLLVRYMLQPTESLLLPSSSWRISKGHWPLVMKRIAALQR